MLDPNRPPTSRSEEPEHETVVWDRLRAEAESSRGSSVFPAAKLSDASESVYLEYDDDELLEAMHADEDEDAQASTGGATKRPSQSTPPAIPGTLPAATLARDVAGDYGTVDEQDDDLADEDLSDELSALAHLTVQAEVADAQDDDDADRPHPEGQVDAERSSQPPLLLQRRSSPPPMLPSRASQPPLSTTRSSQPGTMDRTFPPPNERERGSQPPSHGYTFQAAVPPSYGSAGSSEDRGSNPPPLSGRSSQPPLPMPASFVTAETVEDPFAQVPEQSIFERTKDLLEPPAPAAQAIAPGARWEQAWADWDRQFDIPSLPVEHSVPSRPRMLPVALGVLALIGLSAAGFQLMGSGGESEAPTAAQATASGGPSAEQVARDEAAVRAANEALEQMARAEAESKKRSAEKLAALNNDDAQQQAAPAEGNPSGGMSKADERARYKEERRAARREARHRKRELKRQQARAEAAAARSGGSADASKKGKAGASDDPLYGVGEEEE